MTFAWAKTKCLLSFNDRWCSVRWRKDDASHLELSNERQETAQKTPKTKWEANILAVVNVSTHDSRIVVVVFREHFAWSRHFVCCLLFRHNTKQTNRISHRLVHVQRTERSVWNLCVCVQWSGESIAFVCIHKNKMKRKTKKNLWKMRTCNVSNVLTWLSVWGPFVLWRRHRQWHRSKLKMYFQFGHRVNSRRQHILWTLTRGQSENILFAHVTVGRLTQQTLRNFPSSVHFRPFEIVSSSVQCRAVTKCNNN